MIRLQDLTGKRYGRLIVVGMSEKRTASRGGICICQCDCGNIKEVASLALKSGATVSCGCYNKEYLRNNIVHGHNRVAKRSITYTTWDKMMSRCYREKDPGYSYYGGRGIIVCERWHKFENFLEDMGERPNKKHSIDRIDSNGNYEPENCRWATQKQQMQNMSRNVFYEYKGEKKTIAELADIAGVKYDTMYCRLKRQGLTPEQAVGLAVIRWGNEKRYQQALASLNK